MQKYNVTQITELIKVEYKPGSDKGKGIRPDTASACNYKDWLKKYGEHSYNTLLI